MFEPMTASFSAPLPVVVTADQPACADWHQASIAADQVITIVCNQPTAEQSPWPAMSWIDLLGER